MRSKLTVMHLSSIPKAFTACTKARVFLLSSQIIHLESIFYELLLDSQSKQSTPLFYLLPSPEIRKRFIETPCTDLVDASQYAHYVFKAFDHDGSGTINFQEFVLGLSTISRGSPTEKLQWTFNLYDINGDGCITREEMREIITSIYSLLGRFTEPSVSPETTRDHADRVFDKLDLNKDGIVTFDEFLETCLNDENITMSLTLLDTVL
ncbi:calsenilin [Caerostris darwini]|uniref:Calsenilin n=1 Tax=Caerostris darwini TaxID=1538125 RepID=A0AAV4UPF6_9ARAC|nr:calsenilin [Caerostris darwini]